MAKRWFMQGPNGHQMVVDGNLRKLFGDKNVTYVLKPDGTYQKGAYWVDYRGRLWKAEKSEFTLNTEVACNRNCETATNPKCECSCGGKNHGIAHLEATEAELEYAQGA